MHGALARKRKLLARIVWLSVSHAFFQNLFFVTILGLVFPNGQNFGKRWVFFRNTLELRFCHNFVYILHDTRSGFSLAFVPLWLTDGRSHCGFWKSCRPPPNRKRQSEGLYHFYPARCFCRSFVNVRFGMLIKTKTGFEIGGAETPFFHVSRGV